MSNKEEKINSKADKPPEEKKEPPPEEIDTI